MATRLNASDERGLPEREIQSDDGYTDSVDDGIDRLDSDGGVAPVIQRRPYATAKAKAKAKADPSFIPESN